MAVDLSTAISVGDYSCVKRTNRKHPGQMDPYTVPTMILLWRILTSKVCTTWLYVCFRPRFQYQIETLTGRETHAIFMCIYCMSFSYLSSFFIYQASPAVINPSLTFISLFKASYTYHIHSECVCVCVFFPFTLLIRFVPVSCLTIFIDIIKFHASLWLCESVCVCVWWMRMNREGEGRECQTFGPLNVVQ